MKKGSIFGGAFLGVILIIVSVVLLWNNEKNRVETTRALNRGEKTVLTVPNDSISAENEKMVVHTTGTITSPEILNDPHTGITTNSLKLRRSVEMYQWHEERLEDSSGDVVAYNYSLDWSSSPIESSEFNQPAGHTNPPFPFEDETYGVDTASIGTFTLGSTMIDKISAYESYTISPQLRYLVEQNAQLSGADTIYIGRDMKKPEAGDLRVMYEHVPHGTFSLIGEQQGETIVSHVGRHDKTIALVESGQLSADELFKEAQSRNKAMGWFLRILGFVLMFIGIKLALSPLTIITKSIPVVGWLANTATGLIAFVVSLSVSIIVISLSWVTFRPLLSIPILIIAVVGLVWFVRKKKKEARPKPMPRP